ncbi:MAG: hypothetical protein EA378_09705 [Phycisphaerales bacterium]|nr:MAG: hypothetical protein EA378_09705 [Phycisphaerales bacterium]
MPKPLRLVALAVSVAVAISSLLLGGAMVYGALFEGDPNWPGIGFEAIILVAALFGVGVGLNRFREGPAMALACVIGVVVVGSGLGRLTEVQNPAAVLTDAWFLARMAAGFALTACVAIAVVGRHPNGWKTLGIGLGLLGLLAAISIGVYTGRGLLSGGGGAAAAVGKTVFALVVVLLISALLCASVHYLVRAFELGRARDDAPPADR